jgi:Tfp pilus assembly protein PilV
MSPSIITFSQGNRGFSLLEAMLCMTMLSLLMLPLALTLGMTGNNSQQGYLQSSRNILTNSLKAEDAPTNPDFMTTFKDSSMNTSMQDTGTTLPYRRMPDTSASDVFKRTTYYYFYTNSADASSAARYRAMSVSYPRVFRMRFGSANGLTDTVHRYWFSDNAAAKLYDGTNNVPGWTATHTAANFSSNDILNTVGNDDLLFQADSDDTTENFSMDVPNGYYTIKVYWCETTAAVNATSNRRLSKITIEGVQDTSESSYSAYESTGGSNYAHIKMYDAYVGDSVLNLSWTVTADSDVATVNPHGIEVIRRTMQ